MNRRSQIDLVLRTSFAGEGTDRASESFRFLQTEVGKARTGIAQLQGRLTALGKEKGAVDGLIALEAELNDARSATDNNRRSLQQLASQFALTGVKTTEQAAQFERLRLAVSSGEIAQSRFRAQIGDTRRFLGLAGASTAELARVQGDLARRISSTQGALSQQTRNLNTMSRAASGAAGAISRAGTASQTAASGFRTAGAAAQGTSRGLRAASFAGNLAATAVGGAATAVINAARGFLEANKSLETTTRTLTITSGSAASAASEIQFLRSVAERTGIPVSDLGNAFAKLSVSAKASGFEASAVREIFGTLSESLANIGISSQDAQGALKAIEQSISKGKFQAEELRNQLGDRLPGALGIFADSLGKSRAEVEKLLEQGKLFATQDNVLNFVRAIGEAYGATGEQIETITAAQGRLSQALANIATETGGADLLRSTFDFAADAANLFTFAVGAVKNAIVTVGDSTRTFDGEMTKLVGRLEGVEPAADAATESLTLLEALEQATKKSAEELKLSIESLQSSLKLLNKGEIDGLGAALADASLRGAPLEKFFAEELPAAVKKSGATLPEFTRTFNNEFLLAGGSAEVLGETLEAVVQGRLEDIGVTAKNLGNEFTEAFDEILTAIDNFGDEANLDAVFAAFNRGLDVAKTREEIEALTAALEDATELYPQAGDRLAESLERASGKMATLGAEATLTDALLQEFGVTGTAAFQEGLDRAAAKFGLLRSEGRATSQDIAAAFRAFVTNALAGFSSLTEEQRRQRLESIESAREAAKLPPILSQAAKEVAATTGNTEELTAELKKASAAAEGLKTIGDIQSQFDGSAASIKKAGEDLEKARKSREAESKAAQKSAASSKEAAEAAGEQAEAVLDTSAASEFLSTIIANAARQIAKFSVDASKTFADFTKTVRDVKPEVDSLDASLEAANERLAEGARLATRSGGVFSQVAGIYIRRAAQFEIAAIQQAQSVERILETATVASQRTLIQLAQTEGGVEQLRQRFNLLNEQRFDALIAGLRQVAEETRQIEEAARNALQQQRLLNAQSAGDDEEVLRLQQQQELAELEALRQQAQDAQSGQARLDAEAALREARERQERERRELAAQQAQAARERREAAAAGDSSDAPRARNANTPGDASSGSTGTVNNNIITVVPLPPEFAEEVARAGITEDIVRDIIQPGIERNNQLR